MKSIDRIVIFCYLIFLTIILSLFLLIPLGFISTGNVLNLVNSMIFEYKWYYFGLAVLIIALNLKLIIGITLGENTRKMGVVRFTSMGELSISFETIKTLVMKAAGGIRGIRDIKVMIKPGKDKINIMIKTLIMPDINIPDTVKAVQESVKVYIESMTEIPVGEVKVVVTDVVSSTRLRLE